MLGEGKVLCWGTSHFSVSSVPRPSLSLSTMGGAVQVGGEEEEGSSWLWVWGILGPSWGHCPGMRFCYQCEKPGQKGAASPCGASGGGRAPWCRGEFQGELPGWCCQLAQWAAGFSSDEDVLNLLRLEQLKDVLRRPASGLGPRCSWDARCTETRWGQRARTLILPGWKGLGSTFSPLQGFSSWSGHCMMRLGGLSPAQPCSICSPSCCKP